MSSDIAAGRSSRRIMVVAAAALAVAMMLAVPIFVAADSDADFTKDEAGYRIEATNPTDADLMSVGLGNRTSLILDAISGMNLFNDSILGVPTVTSDSFKVLNASGYKIESDKGKSLYASEVSAENVKITFTAVASGELMMSDTSDLSEKQKAAYDALKAYLGNEISAGDTITLTGTVKMREAFEIDVPYKMLDGNKCIRTGETMTSYGVEDTSLTATLKHADTEKKVSYTSDIKGTSSSEDKYEFASDPIVVGTKYTVKNTVSTSIKGDAYYTVDGKDYSMYSDPTPVPEKQRTVTEYDIDDQSSVNIPSSYKAKIDALPASTDTVKVDKTYDSAESAFDDVMMDAVGKDVLKLLLIIGGVILGVIVLIIILVIVLLHMRTKKRQQ